MCARRPHHQLVATRGPCVSALEPDVRDEQYDLYDYIDIGKSHFECEILQLDQARGDGRWLHNRHRDDNSSYDAQCRCDHSIECGFYLKRERCEINHLVGRGFRSCARGL